MNDARPISVFGKRREPHTVIIARGDHIRHFTIRPWVAALAGCFLAALAIGYLGATTYLVLRDDLIGASNARQARMQQAYEDRISMLRAQVDRITSRQLLDQQVMETKVAELIERQARITERQGLLEPVLERFGGSGTQLPGEAPLPAARPEQRAQIQTNGRAPRLSSTVVSADITGSITSFWASDRPTIADNRIIDQSDRIFASIDESLGHLESQQSLRLGDLIEETVQTAGQIAEALDSVGFSVTADFDNRDMGGPFVPLDLNEDFEAQVEELGAALDHLDKVRSIARDVPVHNPAPGQQVSSNFGPRRDPFLGRRAMHAGIDFRAPTGTPILASGKGNVVRAGWNGGYGRMVEIDHGEGITTRYAHMSRINVKVGDKVTTGDRIGLAGSTGRSTGPHLHYEVRRNGRATDPAPFLRAGRQLNDVL